MLKFAVFALALSLAPAAAFAKEPIFVSAEQSEARLILPDFAADGSDAQKAELARLHEIEAARTPQQEEAAKTDEANETVFLYRTVFGDGFTEANLPLTAALGKRVANDESPNANVAKQFFHRKRPYSVDATLHPVCKVTAKDNSYPSGHATVGWLLGLTLVEMVPEKREAILARALDYSHNRIICGVHYPSDVEASRALAYAVHAIMAQNPDYRTELAAAKVELRKALNLADAP